MTWLKTALFVMHHLVGKQKHGLAASGNHLCALSVSDDGVENDPFLYYAEGQVLVVLSSREDHILQTQLGAAQLYP